MVRTALIERVGVSDPDRVTDVGSETGGAAAETVWQRVTELYRTGMHPGIQLCVRHRGDVVLNRAIGHARGVEAGRPPGRGAARMRVDTPVNLFSAAKAVTAVVMHKLEADGVLSLHEPIASYLPGFERHGKGRITLHQVLNHRADIPSLPPEALDLDLLDDPATVEAHVLELRPRGGSGPAYHTLSGGFVMDMVVRRVTGESLREVLARDFKQPLGMTWFDYGVSGRDVRRVARNVVTGFRLSPVLSRLLQRVLGMRWEEAVKLSNDPRFLRAVIPSANLITTAHDVAKFYACVMQGGEVDGVRVLEEATVDRLLFVPNRRLEIDRMLGLPLRYGNGFMMGTHTLGLYGWNRPRAFGHVGLSNVFTWADPQLDIAVALLTTGKPVLGSHLLALPRLIADINTAFAEPRLRPGMLRSG